MVLEIHQLPLELGSLQFLRHPMHLVPNPSTDCHNWCSSQLVSVTSLRRSQNSISRAFPSSSSLLTFFKGPSSLSPSRTLLHRTGVPSPVTNHIQRWACLLCSTWASSSQCSRSWCSTSCLHASSSSMHFQSSFSRVFHLASLASTNLHVSSTICYPISAVDNMLVVVWDKIFSIGCATCLSFIMCWLLTNFPQSHGQISWGSI